MTNRYARIVAATIVILLLSLPGVAQQEQKKRFTSASLDGATGLFHTWDAETLRQGEFNIGFGANYTNRDPGRLIMRNFPAAIGVGLFDRFEVFLAFDIQKSVGSSGLQTYRVMPGGFPRPSTNLMGTTSYSNPVPFMDVPGGSDRGDFRFGGIFNAASERRGDPLGVGFAGFMKIAGDTAVDSLNRGITNGATETGFALLLSKRAGRTANLHLNLGGNFAINPKLGMTELADLKNSFIYKAGAAFPAYGMFQFIAELNGILYDGSRSGLNPKSPLDMVLGFKVYPEEWISLGGGYQAHFNRMKNQPSNGILESGRNGFVIQALFNRRRHDPPQVSCSASPVQIIQGEKAVVSADVVEPEGAVLTYDWNASGGRLTGSGNTATFDATGVDPGRYAVTLRVSDDYGHMVPCTSEINVEKRYLPPTVTIEPPTANIMVGESVALRAIGNSPDGSPLTYSWTVNGQPLAATGPTINFGTEGRQPGTYNVTVTVNTGKFTASSTATVTVRERPIPLPTIECLTPTVDIESGGTAELRVRAAVEGGTPVTVTWAASGGTVSGTGQTATFNGAGLSAGTYTVTATADNGRGGRASCTMTVNVSQRIQISGAAGFNVGSARVNNVAKAILDNVAVQMSNDPRLRASVAGFSDSSPGLTSLGLKRAQAVVDYLVSKGVDASRLTATDGGVSTIGDNKTAAGRKENRRVEIVLSVR